MAPSLDTVGWFARTPELLDRVRVCLTGRLPLVPRLDPPRLAMLRFSDPEMRSADSQQALSRFAALATSAGASVVEISLPESYVHLYADQPIVMAYEAARSFTWERLYRTSGLSTELLELLEKGTSIDPQVYDLARSHKALALSDEEELFSGADALITPAALGEAPEGLKSTGDPRFSRLWTLVGSPTVAVPVATGITGLPIGIQLIGRLGDDSRLLGIAQWCSRLLEGINSGGSIIAH